MRELTIKIVVFFFVFPAFSLGLLANPELKKKVKDEHEKAVEEFNKVRRSNEILKKFLAEVEAETKKANDARRKM